MKKISMLALLAIVALPTLAEAAPNPADANVLASKYYVDSGLNIKANKSDLATVSAAAESAAEDATAAIAAAAAGQTALNAIQNETTGLAAAHTAIDAVETQIGDLATKAEIANMGTTGDAGNVYTKTEADAKFLESEDLTDYATITQADAVSTAEQAAIDAAVEGLVDAAGAATIANTQITTALGETGAITTAIATATDGLATDADITNAINALDLGTMSTQDTCPDGQVLMGTTCVPVVTTAYNPAIEG